MSIIFVLLGAIFGLASLVCWIIILIDAFKSAIWKGIVGILCGLYLLYYAFAEFQHEKKWTIVLTALLGGIVANIFYMMGGMGAQR
jgi:uncharacterized membrane protein HdeD (DUF308 family)